MRWCAGLVLMLLSGCVVFPETVDRDARILAMGDSILAWNRPQSRSIPDVVEQRLGQPVLDVSVPGARMRQGGLRGAIGFSIPDQYRAGAWDAVILNGGGNDLLSQCGCNRCEAVLDRLVLQDYPNLLDRLGEADVFILGYYGPAGDRPGDFDACEDDLLLLEERLVDLAARRPNVHVVQYRAAITGKPALYDDDRIHPSPSGSQVIGEILAQALGAKAGLERSGE